MQPLDLFDELTAMKAAGQPFAVATVVRTVALTAAKAGAKALIRLDGSVSAGWIGGGCARAAVVAAARAALRDGRPRLISVQPEQALLALGVVPGQAEAGVEFARNLCPSQGSMDIFVEPVLPGPELLICGASPVAMALAQFAKGLGFTIVSAGAAETTVTGPKPGPETGTATGPKIGPKTGSDRIVGGDLAALPAAERYVVVATQGQGDEAALAAALSSGARYVAFVGSRRKAAALRSALAAKGVAQERLEAVHCPAGLDIGAVTPEEIALSILAQVVEYRRRGHRLPAAGTAGSPAECTVTVKESSHGHER
jgi:xanthine dehydrogenase accessory factor